MVETFQVHVHQRPHQDRQETDGDGDVSSVRDFMEDDKSSRKIKPLKILAEGCRKHPACRARRPATQRCPECVAVWNARLELNDMFGELETTVDQYWNMILPSQ